MNSSAVVEITYLQSVSPLPSHMTVTEIDWPSRLDEGMQKHIMKGAAHRNGTV